MITQEQYLEAKKIVEAYNRQLDLYIADREREQQRELLKTKKGDYVTYAGGSASKNLIKGRKYRLTCTPWSNRIAVITETGKRKVFNQRLFSV